MNPKKKSEIMSFKDKWHIFEMEALDDDYLNMETQAYIEIESNNLGSFQFGLVSGELLLLFERPVSLLAVGLGGRRPLACCSRPGVARATAEAGLVFVGGRDGRDATSAASLLSGG